MVLLVLALGAGSGASATCVALGPGAADAPTLGHVAIGALATTLRSLEAALPRTVIASRLPVPPDDPLFEDLRYLRERELLPRDLGAGDLDRQAWQAILDTLAGWYALGSRPVGPFDGPESILADLEGIVARVFEAARPVALLAWDPEDEDRLAFVGVVWNWSPYPRLIVRRPPPDARMDEGAAALAGRITVCGRSLREYIAASAPVARELFMANAAATMYVVGSEPADARAWPYRVPDGDEVAVFAFEHPEVRELEAFSAVFVGDRLSMLSMVRLLPTVRTNLSPMGLVRVMQTPPRR